MKLCQRVYVHTIEFENNFIFNGLTGSIDLANRKVAEFLKSKDIDKLNDLESSEIDELIKSGYLIEDDSEISEEYVFDKYVESLGKRYDNNHFEICPTMDCNLCCPYCFERDFKNRKDTLDEEKLNRVFEFILERIKENPRPSNIELFGGEPLLKKNYHIIEKIFDFAKENDIGILITTNGTQLNEFKQLFSKFKEQVKQIQVTLDGDKKTHDNRRIFKDGSGSFDIIIKNITKILDLGFKIDVRVNIDKFNIENISQLVNGVINSSELPMYDNFSYYFSNVTDYKNLNNNTLIDEADLAIALDQLNLVDKGKFPLLGYLVDSISSVSAKRLPSFTNCEANSIYNYVITPDGYVCNCPEAIEIENYTTWKYYPETVSFDTSDNGFYKNILNDSNRPKCQKCNIALLCGGGCVMIKNDKSRAIQFCSMQKETVNKYLNYLRKKLELC
ncbi:radical SAM/SPASM domain-containing protein [Abyssisolibacter fermentans]|uniref:radical SAM/SPASM domain-containing protein n=1 Tax=Abyssisolibacter fermentans TaxID=1766203 RepID=UPI00082A3DDD|nr:radical SAM protein [Abyssisolibacter fermentans]